MEKILVKVTARENNLESGQEIVFETELERFSAKKIKQAIELQCPPFEVDYFYASYDTKHQTSQGSSRRTKNYVMHTHHSRKIVFKTLEVSYYSKKSRWF